MSRHRLTKSVRGWHVRVAVAGAAALVGLSTLVAATGNSTAQERPTLASHAASATVTLVTGDRVTVDGSGAPMGVLPANPADPEPFAQYPQHGDWYVIPGDAVPLLKAGTLDRELFNVSGLVRQGYDDAHTDALPLLIKAGAPPAEARRLRSIPTLGITAVAEPKKDTTKLWARLTGERAKARTTVWLNRKVHASLDASVPQIGAPDAWQAGYLGRGVTVAVLDSGIATDHADFAGRIGATKDFTGTSSVADDRGHGTHVASIVAGSGAASGGRYKGVAPEATLAVGKVLDATGGGSTDWVLAGMEWAATETGATVVNMSLGGGPSDGTDVVSQAVNELTERTGVLFVAAAGNEGEDQYVETPAAADAALAVGSVSRQGALSDFSSRGPRPGDLAVKPDLTAPGEDIVAARPAGVEPLGETVGDGYQRISGTSMATPHVAGTAALLAQQHPDWEADRLKAVLMNSAAPVAGAGVYQVGAGRVDAARAVSQRVYATRGSVSAFFPWPNAGAAERRPVTYENPGAAPVTLSLALSGDAPVTLPASTVTVPAGGRATVDLSIAARDGKSGTFGGVLTATGPDGLTVRTPVGVAQEPEMYDLTTHLLDRDGQASAEGYGYLIGIDTDVVQIVFDGTKLRVPAGRYGIQSSIETAQDGREPSRTMMFQPELSLRGDMDVTLDARRGHRVRTTLDEPAAQGGFTGVSGMTRMPDGGVFQFIGQADPRLFERYAGTVDQTSSGDFMFVHSESRFEPPIEMRTEGADAFEVNAYPMSPVTPELRERLTAVYGGQGRPEDLAGLDLAGKLVLLDLPASLPDEEREEPLSRVKAAGGKAAAVWIDRDRLALGQTQLDLPVFQVAGVTGRRLLDAARRGTVTVNLTTHPVADHRYELAYPTLGTVPPRLERTVRTKDLVAVPAAYHTTGASVSRRKVRAQAKVWDGMGYWSFEHEVRPGAETTEYFTPGAWDLMADEVNGLRHETLAQYGVQVAADKPTRLVWGKAVAGPLVNGCAGNSPGAVVTCAARTADTISARLALYGDSAGHARKVLGAAPWPEEDDGTTSLYRDGQLVAKQNTPGTGTFAVPASDAAYQLVVDATRTADWWPLSTRVQATWGFRSSAAGNGKALPLLAVRFDPGVDLRNTAPGNRAFAIPISVERQAGSGAAKVTSLTVEVSYDDGVTWQKAPVKAGRAHLRHPASGFVSLRATATDADGNTVEETIVRAYQLR